jgi:hypothetical protein
MQETRYYGKQHIYTILNFERDGTLRQQLPLSLLLSCLPPRGLRTLDVSILACGTIYILNNMHTQ